MTLQEIIELHDKLSVGELFADIQVNDPDGTLAKKASIKLAPGVNGRVLGAGKNAAEQPIINVRVRKFDMEKFIRGAHRAHQVAKQQANAVLKEKWKRETYGLRMEIQEAVRAGAPKVAILWNKDCEHAQALINIMEAYPELKLIPTTGIAKYDIALLSEDELTKMRAAALERGAPLEWKEPEKVPASETEAKIVIEG